MIFNSKTTSLRSLNIVSIALLATGFCHVAASETAKPTEQVAQITAADLEQCKKLGLSSCPEPFDKTMPDPEKMLTWDQATRISGFRNTFRMYAGDVFSPLGAKPYPLPKAKYELPAIEYTLDGKKYNLNDYLKNQNTTGLIILKKGELVYEYYGHGNTSKSLWTSRSVAKSVVTVLMGVAVQEGLIKSTDDPIVKYIPELKGSAWESVTIHQLMQHTSGTIWNEDYADPNSDFAHMTLCEATADPFKCVFELVKGVPAKHKPGEVFEYNTGGAWLVGVVLERVTGTTIAKYLESRVWSQFGMEREGVWHALVKDKIDMGGHGFNASLPDWARFALFVSKNGELPNGKKILPADWVKKSTTWTQAKNSVSPDTPDGKYGYQWWHTGIDPKDNSEPKATPTSKQTFTGLGIFGQRMTINPAEELIVVQWSAWKTAVGTTYQNEQTVFVNAVSNALKDK